MTKNQIKMTNAGITLFSILTLLLAAGCASPRRAYEAAHTQDNRQAYVNFLREFPEGEYSQQAKDRIAELDYQAALKPGTPEALRAYLKRNPRSKYAPDVEARLSQWEQDDFAKARAQDTAAGWEVFLKVWPKSAQLAEARRLADAASMREAFAHAKQAGTREPLEAFLNKWPQSPLAPEAETLLEAISFAAIEKAPTVALCRNHLARFKTGPHAAQVAAILKPLEADERIQSASTSKIRSDLAAAIQDYPENAAVGPLRTLLAQRDQEVSEQCRASLGHDLATLASGSVFVEACAWAKIGRHQAFGGDYLGLVASISVKSSPLHLDQNTFVEYADGTFGRNWVIWFPDWEYRDNVVSENGTSLSAEIEMPGFKKGEAWGRHGGMVGLGYGSMLFHGGRMGVNYNMAYSNQGQKPGALDVDPSLAPSTHRFLLLFPKNASAVKRISIGGAVFPLQE